MQSDWTEVEAAFYRYDAPGVPWRLRILGREHAGRWELTDMHLESRGQGRLTGTILQSLMSQLAELRDYLPSVATGQDIVSAHPDLQPRPEDGEFDVALRAVGLWVPETPDLRREWESWPQPEPDDQPEPARRRGPARDDDLWRRRAEAMAGAWAQRRPMVDALRELEPGASESTYNSRITRARRWDREVNGGTLLSGTGRRS